MADRQWFVEGVQVFEEGVEEFFVEGVQVNENQAPDGPPNNPTNLQAIPLGSTMGLTWDREADGAELEVWRKV